MKKSQKINDYVFVILSLLSSMAFLFCLLIKQKFVATQFLFFFLSMFLPNIIEFIFKLKIAPFMQLIYELYLILHFILGEICNFYVLFNYYDTILHFTTAILLSILGYSIIHYYLDDKVIFIQVLFAFLFALSSEFFWEILEFSIDHFFDTNMQRFIKNGIVLKGHEALKDTIKDMVVASIGSSSISFLIKLKVIKNAKITIKNAYKWL